MIGTRYTEAPHTLLEAESDGIAVAAMAATAMWCMGRGLLYIVAHLHAAASGARGLFESAQSSDLRRYG